MRTTAKTIKTIKKAKLDKDDARSLLEYIEGHVLHARTYIDQGDVASLRQQAIEIQGWAEGLLEIATAAAE